MGACQDCWVALDDGTRLRACTSFVAEGMRIVTRSAVGRWTIEPPIVIGAGPAGSRAAATLAAAGLAPIVLDEAPASGGQIYRRAPAGFTRPYRALYGFDAAKARRVHDAFDGIKGSIDYRPDTLVWDLRARCAPLPLRRAKSRRSPIATSSSRPARATGSSRFRAGRFPASTRWAARRSR